MNRRDLDLLARRLEAWLAPEDIIAAVHSLAKNPTAASKPASLILSSPFLQPADDGGLAYLCKEYLQRFFVPAVLISLLQNIEPNSSLDAEWTLVANARFTGTVEPTSSEATGQPHSVSQITDKDFLVDILVQPLKGLQGMVAT